MKHKVSELEGALLDAAVAMAEGLAWRIGLRHPADWPKNQSVAYVSELRPGVFETGQGLAFMPSGSWSAGGPIIERACISLDPESRSPAGLLWLASVTDITVWYPGPTPLIAAMRAYVAAKIGEEVELPVADPVAPRFAFHINGPLAEETREQMRKAAEDMFKPRLK